MQSRKDSPSNPISGRTAATDTHYCMIAACDFLASHVIEIRTKHFLRGTVFFLQRVPPCEYWDFLISVRNCGSRGEVFSELSSSRLSFYGNSQTLAWKGKSFSFWLEDTALNHGSQEYASFSIYCKGVEDIRKVLRSRRYGLVMANHKRQSVLF